MHRTLGRLGLASALLVGLAFAPHQAGAEDPEELTVSCDDPDFTGTGGLIIGTDGTDVIQGSDGTDFIQGLGGDDYICGGGGSDFIFGGEGDDSIIGNLGNDAVFGGDGDDLVYGGGGDDTVFGGEDSDECSGGGSDSDLDVSERDLVLCESRVVVGEEEEEPATHTQSP